MGIYRVNFGTYSLLHSDRYKYFDFFEYDGKKYPIGTFVNLTERGMSELYYNSKCGYNYVKGGFRLVDHYITEKGTEEWTYIIGHRRDSNTYVFHSTKVHPDDLICDVLHKEINETIYTPGELKVTFIEQNYSPKDWEVDGVILGWIILAFVLVGAFVLKDWWIRLIVQISASWSFGSWREKKINEAIIKQKFKK